MAGMDFSIIVKLVDRVSSPVRNIGNQFDHLNRKIDTSRQRLGALESIGAKLARIGSIASKVGAVSGLSMTGIGASATNIAAKYEDLGAVLETLEGSSEKANTSLAWIKKFTKETPYELENTATAFGRLKAYGIDPMDGTLKTLGDTSAAMGKDIMDSVEMMADAIVGENERLKEFGIRGSAIKGSDMLEYSYKNRAGEQQTIQVNKNDQEAIRKTLVGIFDEKFMGAMEKRSKTFNGILSNMKDTIAGVQGQFMQAGPYEVLKAGLQSRLDFLTRLSESGKVEQWGQRTAQAMTAAGDATRAVADMIGNATNKISAFVGGWGNLGRALGIVKESAAGVGGSVREAVKSGLPEWLRQGGDKGAEMSPVLEQLRLIEKGDTLWNIAKQTTGIGSKYQDIADLNRGIIKDADKIFPGQQIRVPKLSGLPDWVKAKSAASAEQSMVPPQQQQPQLQQQGNAQPLLAVAELAKTNKFLAAAMLVRKAWDSALEFLKEKLAAFKTAVGATFTQVLDFAVANSAAIKTALGVVGMFATGGLGTAFRIGGTAAKVFAGVFVQSMEHIKTRLPALQTAVKTVSSTIGAWFAKNSEKIKTVLSSLAIKAMEKFGKVLDWLSAKAKDASLTQWLDDLLAKFEPAIGNLLAFGRGMLVAGAAIAAAIVWVKDFVGGWENFGKLVVGLMVYAKLAGLIASTLSIIFTLGQIVWATGSALFMFGGLLKSIGVFAFIGRVALLAYLGGYLALSSVMPLLAGAFSVVKGAIMSLSAVMMANPILAIVSAIAIAAVLVYTNWDKIVKWWNGSTLKQQVMPVATATMDYARSKWSQLKSWWDSATLGEKVMGIATAPLQIAKTLATDFFNWWLTTELGQKSLQIATVAIDWARQKAEEFRAWWESFSLKSVTASVTTSINKTVNESFIGKIGRNLFGGGEAKPDGARASGGPVRAGGIYRVNEQGPELLRQRGGTYLMADQDSNVVPLRNMVNRTNERLFGQQGRDANRTQQTIPQVIDLQQRQRQAQEVKTSGVLNIKIDSKEPVRVTRMQASGMQLNVHTGPIGAVS